MFIYEKFPVATVAIHPNNGFKIKYHLTIKFINIKIPSNHFLDAENDDVLKL